MTAVAFDLTAPLPTARTLVEASAGTGKTYAIAVLVARFVAGDLTGHDHDLAEGVAIDEVLVVTYTRAAAAELRDRIRSKLQLAAADFDGLAVPAGEEWLHVFDAGSRRVRQRRSARVRRALARFDDATITTIHGFCQQALAQSGLRAGTAGSAELIEDPGEVIAEVVRDLLLDRLADDPLALSSDHNGRPLKRPSFDPTAPYARQPRTPAEVERYLVQTVRTVLSNPGASCRPEPATGGLAGAWAECVDAAVSEITRRQQARRQIGYDRLVSDLAVALDHPVHGQPLAASLSVRYRLVLVDEFQDTDRLQWVIFDRAFAGHRLITVGDPKQAIFRFRGADVHAYLAAVASAERTTLGTNHRSDRQLLDALALLFDGATLGHDEIRFMRVDASPSAPRNALGDAPVHLRVVPDDPGVAHTRDGMEAGAAAAIVLADVASRVRMLLDTAAIRVGRSAERVRPSDIGILVPSQRRASETADVLRQWGIPTVRARTGSVLHTPAALQWRLLLGGLATPTNARAAKGAGLSWFFDLAPFDLVADVGDAATTDSADTRLAQLQRELASLAERLRDDGVGAFYECMRRREALLAAVLGRQGGDRDLTDLDHLAEVLVTATARTTPDPARVAETLERLVADADDQAEATMRRIESDDDAVHITTVHSAKGLEYPIVLVPFAYMERPAASRPYVFNDGGRRVVDVASWITWGDGVEEGSKPAGAATTERKRLATMEVEGDSARLLYVACTRAKHHLELWWAPTKGAGKSPLGRLLLDRLGAGPILNSPVGSDYEKAEPAAAQAQIDALVAASNGTIARHDVAIEQAVRRPLPLHAPPPAMLAVADSGTRHPLADSARRTWSFTALSARLLAAPMAVATLPPVAGGYDEVVASAAVAIDAEIAVESHTANTSATTGSNLPLAAAPAGPTFGIAVHEVLERLDFTSPSLPDDIGAEVGQAARRLGLELDGPALAGGLEAVVDTPLGKLFDGRRLRDLALGDRLRELKFDLTLDPGRVLAADIGAVLAELLDPADPLRDYGKQLAAELAGVELAGWLTGSLDAVIRVGVDTARFVVADYKTNRLHAPGATDPLAAYHPDALVTAMTHSHYPLQAALYCVALHRFLRWRLGSRYEPEQHLGGVAYLFVRGMTGAATPMSGATPYGVFAWEPPADVVLALDDLFAGKARR